MVFVPISEAARQLALDPRTVARLAEIAGVEPARDHCNRRYFTPAQVEALQRARTPKARKAVAA